MSLTKRVGFRFYFDDLAPLSLECGYGCGCVWAIASSWGFSPQNDRIFTALVQRLPAGIASLVSMVPGLGLGVLCEYLCDGSLGKSWVVSLGLLAAVACGVCELGRRTAGGSD
jgi:hypothetical protein